MPCVVLGFVQVAGGAGSRGLSRFFDNLKSTKDGKKECAGVYKARTMQRLTYAGFQRMAKRSAQVFTSYVQCNS